MYENKDFYILTKRKRSTLVLFAYGCTFLNGCASFPLNYNSIIPSVIIGVSFFFLYNKKYSKIFFHTLGLNILGLLFRFTLEYSDSFLLQSLTFFNIILFILSIPIIITLVYYLLSKLEIYSSD